jgi:protease-4
MQTKLLCVAAMLALHALAVPAAAGEAKAKSAAEPVVAVFSMDGPVVETPMGDDFLFGSIGAESLHDLVTRLEKARDDKRVKAVVFLVGDASLGLAQVEEIRRVVDGLKAAGKEVYAHADSLSLRSYTLVCGASKVSVVPTGDLWITGLYGESPYLRGLLDKIGVKPDFLTCGTHKSAAEIFMRKEPSPQAEAMQNWLMDSIFETNVGLIASGRRVPPEKVRQWIDGGPYSAAKALKLGLIDAAEFRRDFLAAVKAKFGAAVKLDTRYGKQKGPEVDLSSPLGVFKLWAEILQGPAKKKPGKDAVAIVYVEGPILPGKSTPSLFGAERAAYSAPISKALDEAAEDKSIKAVVLRVHSPGGSATASEIILNAANRVKAKKPFAVSMGGVAGSGGYYVACGADTIFADASTITASIGVVGGKFATTEMWSRIGVAWKGYKRGAGAGILGSEDVFSPAEREKLQAWMNEIYEVFKGHVTAARGNRLKKKLDEIAGGRVYTGRQALDLGLVDKIGTLDDAIRHVARQANLKDYDVRVIPRPRNFMEVLIEEMSGQESDDRGVSVSLSPLVRRQYGGLLEAALPYLDKLEPERIAAVKAALQRLSLLQHERAVLMMPEMDFSR